ncbi:hypothetical protein G6F56_003410 [Rhizopus delemar]|nr:hypothetical protein G6F56_003410 [Rhizopus delemar]
MTEKVYKINPDFEEEIKHIKELSNGYSRVADNDFRLNISRCVTDTYRGLRSIDSFVLFASAVIIDQDGFFKERQLQVFNMFINTLKSMDIRLEILRESEEAKHKEELVFHTNILTKMINGLVRAEALTHHDCKVHFSSQLLKDCDIIANKLLFDRRLIRLNTAILYKQQKFNLVREENEGYASLMNELTMSSIVNGRDAKGKLKPASLEKIPSLLQTISSHIGIFHLDPNRVLGIILDMLINQLLTNYNFWIQIMKQSPWIQELTFMDLSGEQSVGPSANLAQLIGFKFHNYHSQEVKPAPQELYLTIALLLKHDLVSLNDIVPHLYGALGEEGHTQKIKRAEAPVTTSSGQSSSEKKYEANDVVELTKAMFSVGDLKNATMIISFYDKLVDMFPHLAYSIYHIARVILRPAYEAYVSDKSKMLYSRFSECAEQSHIKSVFTNEEDRPKLSSQLKLKRVLVTDALLDEVRDLRKMEQYVFFYSEWKEDLQMCESFEHLTTRFMPLMRLAGCRTYLATDLIQHLILIISGLLDREKELPESRVHLTSMIREFLMPAISFSKGNPGTMASVWEILYRISFQERYSIYGEWSNEFYKKNIENKLLKARVERAVKSVMRRVSKNDVRRCGRDLGKLAHSNPTIVFNVVLDQVQSFDNLAPIMADACRYLGDFSYDVLGFVLTEKWTGSQGAGKTRKDKEKDDGMPSGWLRSLATFTGMLFKKQDIDATPLLRYLSYRLREDDSVADLILLNEFVTKMGGVEILASAYTNDQITAAGCSDSLKSEAFLPISVDNRRASRRVLSRLKDSLRKNNVGFEILVLLYRLSESCLSEKSVPASDRCSKLDRVHQTQLQYFELLISLFEPEEYQALIPSVETLVKDYGLPVHITMIFNRPKTQHVIRNNLETPVTEEVWSPFQETIELLPSLLNIPAIPSIFTSEFYFMFWQLSLYDIHCPITHYEAAIKRHTDMVRQCRDPRSSFYQSNRPSVVSKAERQAQAALDTLNNDLPRHQAHVQKVLSILQASQSRWFPSSMQRQALISNILQHCILPRSKLSEVDAAFCYEFSMLMHQINTVNFSSLTLFDKVLSDSLPADFIAFSEYETTIHSRFIFKALAKMGEWRKDEALYLSGAHGDGLIGFQKNWNADASQGVAKEDLLNFAEFQRVLYKWHFRSCLAIEQALKSGESHLIKNAFLVLRQLMPCFPSVVDHGNSIVKIVKRLAEEEERGNIKVLARSYIGLVTKQKASWTTKNAFSGIREEPKREDRKRSREDEGRADEKSPRTDERHRSASSALREKERQEAKERRPEDSSRHSERDTEERSSGRLSGTSSSRATESTSRNEPSRTSESSSGRAAESGRLSERSRESSRSREPSSSRANEPSSSRANEPSRTSESSSSRANESSRTGESSSNRASESSSSRVNESSRTSESSSRNESSTRNESSSKNEPSPKNEPTNKATEPSSKNETSRTSESSSRNEPSRTSESSSRNESGRLTESSSGRLTESSSTRYTEDRPSSSSRMSAPTSDPRNSSRGSKRPLDDRNRERSERPEKRRERDERRDDRLRRPDDRRLDDRRLDDRRMDERRMEDRRMEERRMEERRFDERRLHDRRERDRDHRSSRRR